MRRFGFACVLVVFSTVALAEMELPRISLSETVSNRYLSKGRRSLDGIVRVDSLYGEWYGVHAGVWSYSDIEGKTHRVDGHRAHGEPVEWDYYGGYGYRFGDGWPVVNSVKVTFRYNYYDAPSSPKSDTEDLRLYINTDSYVKSEFQWRYTTKSDRNIFRVQLSKGIELVPNWKWNNSVSVWFGGRKFNGVSCPGGWKRARAYKRQGNPLGDSYKNALHSLIYTAELDYRFSDYVSLAPYFSLGWALDHDVREGWKAREHCNAFNSAFGCTLKLRF